METKILHAWLIHKKNVGETSINLTLFTAECGLIRCLFKGGKTAKKQAALQLFTPLWVLVKNYPNALYAERIEQEAASIYLSGEALISGLYINEILYRVLKTNLPCQTIFEAYLTVISQLAFAKNRLKIEIILRRFEWLFIEACGYALSLTHDAQTHQAIHAEKYYQFQEGLGLVEKLQGIQGSYIIAMSRNDLDDPDTLKAAKCLMRKAINYLLEGVEIKTRNLYNQLLSNSKEIS